MVVHCSHPVLGEVVEAVAWSSGAGSDGVWTVEWQRVAESGTKWRRAAIHIAYIAYTYIHAYTVEGKLKCVLIR